MDTISLHTSCVHIQFTTTIKGILSNNYLPSFAPSPTGQFTVVLECVLGYNTRVPCVCYFGVFSLCCHRNGIHFIVCYDLHIHAMLSHIHILACHTFSRSSDYFVLLMFMSSHSYPESHVIGIYGETNYKKYIRRIVLERYLLKLHLFRKYPRVCYCMLWFLFVVVFVVVVT